MEETIIIPTTLPVASSVNDPVVANADAEIQQYLADMQTNEDHVPCTNSDDVISTADTMSQSGSGPVMYNFCAGCGEKIADRFLLHAVDRYWHTACLKCSCCQAQLCDVGTSCFSKAGMILCKNDYIRMFVTGGTCFVCRQAVPANEFVMKVQGNVYHLKCFACMSCHNKLTPGDRFGLINGRLICEKDYPKVLKTHIQMQQKHVNKVC